MKKIIVSLCVVMLVAFGITTSVAMAATTDSSGNVTLVEDMPVDKVSKDLYWVGNDFEKSNFNIGYDMVMAGQNITVTNGKVDGAARIACQSVDFTDVDISRNASIAAQTIRFNDCKLDTGYFFGKDVLFDGQAKCLHVNAADAIISGKIDGDLIINSDTLSIQEGAIITGTVKGNLGSEPIIAEGAKVGALNYDIVTESDEVSADEASSGSGHGFAIWWFLASILIWLAMRLFFKKPVEDAGDLMMTKPGKMAGTGAIAMICIPVASLILLITVIGIPLSLILGVIYTIMLMVSVPFAGAAAGQAVFGKLVPKMNAWGSTIIGVVVLLILREIPYVGGIVKLATVLFIIGYFTMTFYAKYIKKDKENLLEEGGYVYATEDEIQ
ncbi:MAG: polymer-forming cytoskeletal protein [Firmicutes bacterium]|nr:polymer-forming cytoskeletal protein [Bacillota bacterium]